MAADLYLPSLIEELQKKLNPLFEDALKERGIIENKNSNEYIEANEKVKRIYKEMWPKSCHFHDAYNSNCVMWSMGLSWWSLVIPMLDKNSQLPLSKCKELLSIIEKSEIDLESHYTKKEKIEVKSLEDTSEEFLENKRSELIEFLSRSIDYKIMIECSL
jgi:hypothetical protein